MNINWRIPLSSSLALYKMCIFFKVIITAREFRQNSFLRNYVWLNKIDLFFLFI